ncbi:hypothetical protein JT06_18475 [Desulfobulbus sp. Tol-SR]|nr:hypothetical protein JT06_18475 [Desulfobulbus sp. Tol-SR]
MVHVVLDRLDHDDGVVDDEDRVVDDEIAGDVGGKAPGQLRDRRARPPLRITAAVELFMMRAHHRGGVGEPHRSLDDVEAVPDVVLHLVEFLFVQSAGLEQDVVADTDLADIVQKRPP